MYTIFGGIMMELQEGAKKALQNPSEIAAFAEVNRLEFDAGKKLLEELVKTPEVPKEVNEYLFSNEVNPQTKAYVAGQEKGVKLGFDMGIGKGIALGVIGTLTFAGLLFLKLKKDE